MNNVKRGFLKKSRLKLNTPDLIQFKMSKDFFISIVTIIFTIHTLNQN